MDAWFDQLRSIRERRGMSRQELAELCGLSAHSLRSYELGRRRPTRQRLLLLLKCLKVATHPRNMILASVGFAPEAPVERFREPNVPPKEAMRLIRQRPLPAFLLNDKAEILAVSGAAWRLLGLREYEQNPPRRHSVLSEIVFRVAASRVMNWDEVFGQTIQFFKAGLLGPSLTGAAPPGDAVIAKVVAGDPALMARFTDLWERTPPFRGRMTGHTYPSVWSTPGGPIHFTVFIGCLNTEVGLYAHSMVPADAQSHLLLDKLLAGRPLRRRVASRGPSARSTERRASPRKR